MAVVGLASRPATNEPFYAACIKAIAIYCMLCTYTFGEKRLALMSFLELIKNLQMLHIALLLIRGWSKHEAEANNFLSLPL